jgi:release factor glutamine methyltransferase
MQDLTPLKHNSGIRDLRYSFVNELLPLYERRECERIIEWVFHDLTGTEKTDFALYPERCLEAEKLSRVQDAMADLKRGKPVQYVLGYTEFCGIKLKVDEHVLIPRPETEELVKWTVDDHIGRQKLKILDIGTGSGCIAIALQKNLSAARVFAADISSGAILVAEMNARSHALPVTFFNLDILNPDGPQSKQVFDIIISNPPYITESEKRSMKLNVLEFEPHMALFVPNTDSMRYYKAIADLANRQLDDAGTVYIEINERFGKEVVKLFKNAGFSLVTLRKDMNGRDRMVRAVR